MGEREWYKGGLRFTCTQCGNCCTGAPGYVWFDQAEAEAIAAHLGLSVEAFIEKYTHSVFGRRSIGERPGEQGYDCVFLERRADGTAQCGIYPVRPRQCRTWPFWPENLKSPEAWQQTRSTCPGSGRGRLYGVDEIRIIRDRTPDL